MKGDVSGLVGVESEFVVLWYWTRHVSIIIQWYRVDREYIIERISRQPTIIMLNSSQFQNNTPHYLSHHFQSQRIIIITGRSKKLKR
jgi:hypothetical protein